MGAESELERRGSWRDGFDVCVWGKDGMVGRAQWAVL